LEVLRDQVQNKVNQSLKAISQSWRQAISNVQNVSTLVLDKKQEASQIQMHLINGVKDMTKYTLKIHLLSICLSQRDPICKSVFQTVQEIEAQHSVQGQT
jgi:hypothetical protein